MFLGAAGRGFSRLKWLPRTTSLAEPWRLRREFSAEAAVADSSATEFINHWTMNESAEAVPGFQDLWSRMKDTKWPTQVSGIAKEWKKEGNAIPKELVDSILLKLCSQGHFSRARTLVEWMERDGSFEMTDKDKVTMLHILSNLDFATPGVARTLKKIESKTEVSYLLALKVYTEEIRVHLAQKLFEELKASNLMSSSQAYTKMLKMYVRIGNKDKALQILKEYEDCGFPPDPSMHWYLLIHKDQFFSGLPVEENARAALEKVEITPMNRRDVMRCYACLGDIDGFNRVWEHVLSNPPVVSGDYLNAIHCCTILGDVEKGEEISNTFKGDNMSFHHGIELLRLYAMHGKMEKALEIQKELLERKFRFHFFQPIIEGYLKQGDVDKAAECFHSFMDRDQNGRLPWASIVDCIVKLNKEFAKTGDVKSAEKLMTKITKIKKGKHATVAYMSLMRVYLGAGLPAYGLRERMIAAQVDIGHEEVKTLLSQLAKV